MLIQPYLFYEGRCDEAIAFYRDALGAETEMVVRYSEAPDAPPPGTLPPGSENKIMHASLRIGESVMMLSDGFCQGGEAFEGFSLSLSARDAAEADRIFTALADGGRVKMPLGKTFFSPCFGMVADRFGVSWMVIVPA